MRTALASAALLAVAALTLVGTQPLKAASVGEAPSALIGPPQSAVLVTPEPLSWSTADHDNRTASTDQTDLTTLPTIHPVYIYPADQPNRFAEFAAYFQAEHRRANVRLTGATGMALRWDERAALDGTSRTVHDITVIRSKNNLKTLSSGKQFGLVREMLAAAGLNRADKKYQVWLDAKSGNCGSAQPTNDQARTAANKADQMSYTVMYRPTGGEQRYAAMGGFCAPVLHELSHALGAVGLWAPNYADGGHCKDDSQDVMCYADSTGPFDASAPRTYDFGNNDYLDPIADLNPDAVATAGRERLDFWTVNLSRFLCPRSVTDRTVPDCNKANTPTY